MRRVLIACGGTIFKREIERRIRKDCLSQLATLLNESVGALYVETINDDSSREPTYTMQIHNLPENFVETHKYDAILLEGCQVSGTWQERADGHLFLSRHIDKVGKAREMVLSMNDGWKLAEKLMPSKYFHKPSKYGFVQTKIPICPSQENFLTDTVISRLCSLLNERGFIVFYSSLVHDSEIGVPNLDGPVIKRQGPAGQYAYDFLKNAVSDTGDESVTCLQQISPWIFQKVA